MMERLLTSMRELFKCKFGRAWDANTGTTFCCSAHEHKTYFFKDPPHMSKLSRKTLGELNVFVDSEGKSNEWKFITFFHQK